MKEAQDNGNTVIPEANFGNAVNNNLSGKESKAPKAQMDYDWSNDDLLGEENELSEYVHDFFRSAKRGSDQGDKCRNTCSDRISTDTLGSTTVVAS
jgi:hypothetical protein